MVRAIIADDEPLAREGIKLRLKKEKDIQVIGEYGSGRMVLSAIKLKRPDLVFLDIQMPSLNGFEVLKRLSPSQCPFVIFITAFDKHAIEAFRFHALDYLLKPIDDKLFHQALERARSQIRQSQDTKFAQRVQSLLSSTNVSYQQEQIREQPEWLTRIAIKSKKKIYFISVKDVQWIEAAGDYLYLHKQSEKHLIRETLVSLESKLSPEQFFRIHKSTLVNINQIKELQPSDHGDSWVILFDGTRLKVTRSRKRALQNTIGIDL